MFRTITYDFLWVTNNNLFIILIPKIHSDEIEKHYIVFRGIKPQILNVQPLTMPQKSRFQITQRDQNVHQILANIIKENAFFVIA